MLQRLKAWLLDLANADPPPTGREQFYGLKERLLKRHGKLVGWENQEIIKPCWSCQGDGACRRCYGDGIYSRRWWSLERWEWCGHIFHRPARELRSNPEAVHIHGRIEHVRRGCIHREALLWLYVLCGQWRLLWRQLNSSYAIGWYPWPMANLQRLLTGGRLKWDWWKWRLRQWWQKRKSASVGDEEIPF